MDAKKLRELRTRAEALAGYKFSLNAGRDEVDVKDDDPDAVPEGITFKVSLPHHQERLAAYVAAANPTMILELLNELERLQRSQRGGGGA